MFYQILRASNTIPWWVLVFWMVATGTILYSDLNSGKFSPYTVFATVIDKNVIDGVYQLTYVLKDSNTMGTKEINLYEYSNVELKDNVVVAHMSKSLPFIAILIGGLFLNFKTMFSNCLHQADVWRYVKIKRLDNNVTRVSYNATDLKFVCTMSSVEDELQIEMTNLTIESTMSNAYLRRASYAISDLIKLTQPQLSHIPTYTIYDNLSKAIVDKEETRSHVERMV